MHVMHGLMNLIRTSTMQFRYHIFALRDGSQKILHGQHRAIYQAVMKGDARAAREAAHLHLSFVEATLHESLRKPRAPHPALSSHWRVKNGGTRSRS